MALILMNLPSAQNLHMILIRSMSGRNAWHTAGWSLAESCGKRFEKCTFDQARITKDEAPAEGSTKPVAPRMRQRTAQQELRPPDSMIHRNFLMEGEAPAEPGSPHGLSWRSPAHPAFPPCHVSGVG